MKISMTGSRSALIASLIAALLWIPKGASAEEKFPIATLAFPAISNIMADLISVNGFDKANGYQLEPVVYGTGGSLWAGLAKGEIFVHNMSPFQLQKMRSDGVPIEMFATYLGMESIQVITKKPGIKKFSDLKGHTIAATVAFTEYDYLDIYAKTLGINLKNDVTVVDATSSMARAQLEADRVDAILSWEPTATMILREDANARVILTGDQAWRAVTGDTGCDLCLIVRTDYTKSHPGSLMRIFKMYQAAAEFSQKHPDEADAIVTSGKYTSKGIPPGTVAAAIKAKHLVLDVRPSWDPKTNAQIWKILEVGYKSGKMPALPDKQAVVATAPVQ